MAAGIALVPRKEINTAPAALKYMDKTPRSEAYNRTIDLHHAQEVYARACARATYYRTKVNTTWRECDADILVGIAKVYGVTWDHFQLFVNIVLAMQKADRMPQSAKERVKAGNSPTRAPKEKRTWQPMQKQ